MARFVLVFSKSFEISQQWAMEEGLERHEWKHVIGTMDVEGRRDYELKVLYGAFEDKQRTDAYRLAQARAGIL